MIRNSAEKYLNKIITPVAKFLADKKVTANSLTLFGLAINFIAAYFYSKGLIILGGFVILFAGIFDMLDGAVARVSNTASKIGAFIDAVVDRYSDFIIFGGICIYFATNGDIAGIVLSLIIISGSYLTSYIRARAELVIPKCTVGLMERPERIILLAAGSIFNFFHIALWILAITTHLTAVYRIYYTYKNRNTSR